MSAHNSGLREAHFAVRRSCISGTDEEPVLRRQPSFVKRSSGLSGLSRLFCLSRENDPSVSVLDSQSGLSRLSGLFGCFGWSSVVIHKYVDIDRSP